MQTEYQGSSLGALFHELRLLRGDELAYRLFHELAVRLGWRKNWLDQKAIVSSRVAAKDQSSAKLGNFFFSSDDRVLGSAVFEERFFSEKQKLLQSADKNISGRISLLGVRYDFSSGQVDWHAGSNGNYWPRDRWDQIDIRNAWAGADVKIVWELNRHQFFVTLGRAYWITGDEKYARSCIELWKSWLEDNPPGWGVNWISSLELSIRSISWIWAYHFFLDSPFFSEKIKADIRSSLWLHAHKIERALVYSEYCARNNHLIGDAAGLALIAICMPAFAESKQWRERGLSVLWQALREQVYPDGSDYEGSLGYHRFVLYFYVLVIRLLQLNGEEVPGWVLERVERMFEFVMNLSKPDGSVPLLGDIDDGKVVLLDDESRQEYRQTLSTGAILFHRGDFKYASQKLWEETFWLFNPGIFQSWEAISKQEPKAQASHPVGGYFVMRSFERKDAEYLLFRCGPHSAPNSPHCHADMLSFELAIGEQNWFTDSGTFTYNSDWEWRTSFRSTPFHNTVAIDKQSQSVPHRTFRWVQIAKPHLHTWFSGPDFLLADGEQDGYHRLADPVIHRRQIVKLGPGLYLIVDWLWGKTIHVVEQMFHCPPGFSAVKQSGDRVVVANPKGERLLLASLNQQDGEEIEIFVGDEERRQGWYSPAYGVRLESPAICRRYQGSLPAVLPTLLYAMKDVDVLNGLSAFADPLKGTLSVSIPMRNSAPVRLELELSSIETHLPDLRLRLDSGSQSRVISRQEGKLSVSGFDESSAYTSSGTGLLSVISNE